MERPYYSITYWTLCYNTLLEPFILTYTSWSFLSFENVKTSNINNIFQHTFWYHKCYQLHQSISILHLFPIHLGKSTLSAFHWPLAHTLWNSLWELLFSFIVLRSIFRMKQHPLARFSLVSWVLLQFKTPCIYKKPLMLLWFEKQPRR